jgi:putative ABC transport system ATP-binding protein
MTVEPGQCMAIKGPSGIGKTSLLNCIAGIAPPDAGSIAIDGVSIFEMSPSKRSRFRLQKIGMIFQFGELLPELTAVENVAVPLRLLGVSRTTAENRSFDWLARLALTEQAKARPEQLSGGEIQRVAIARALVTDPKVVLADEPTGMLDERNTERVINILVQVSKERDVAMVLVTHDPVVASSADRVLHVQDEKLSPKMSAKMQVPSP